VRERSGLLDGRGVNGGASGGEVALDGDGELGESL
jgi:hypothetical protein